MPIAFDAVSHANALSGNTLSWAHTCSGADRVLVVSAVTRNDTPANMPITGITYGGQSLTKVRADEGADDASKRTEIWYLINPPLGTNTVEITYTGAISHFAAACAISLLGVDQSDPVDAHAGATGSGITASATVTTLTDNAWVVDAVCHLGNVLTASAGQASRSEQENLGSSSDAAGASTKGPVSPAGLVTMSWDSDAAVGWAMSAVAFRSAVSVTLTPSAVVAAGGVVDPAAILGDIAIGAGALLAPAQTLDPAVVLGDIMFVPSAATAAVGVTLPAVLPVLVTESAAKRTVIVDFEPRDVLLSVEDRHLHIAREERTVLIH